MAAQCSPCGLTATHAPLDSESLAQSKPSTKRPYAHDEAWTPGSVIDDFLSKSPISGLRVGQHRSVRESTLYTHTCIDRVLRTMSSSQGGTRWRWLLSTLTTIHILVSDPYGCFLQSYQSRLAHGDPHMIA